MSVNRMLELHECAEEWRRSREIEEREAREEWEEWEKEEEEEGNILRRERRRG